jgi:hypothetical protein
LALDLLVDFESGSLDASLTEADAKSIRAVIAKARGEG